MIRSITTLLSAIILLGLLFGCSINSEDKDNNQPDLMNRLSNETLIDTDYIHWIGRTHYNSDEQKQYFYHTAGGFEVTFEGTYLKVIIHATNTDSENLRPYFSVLLNNQTPQEGQVISLTEETSEIVLIDHLPEGVHTIKFLKRSEARDSITAISVIETDGQFHTQNSTAQYNILFLGGSGMSGNGVFGQQGVSRTTENSSSLHAFAYKIAEELDANYQFVASSGWGLKWGYNPTNNDGQINIRSAFDKVGIDDQQNLIDIDFDHLSFIPDFIVINLGGNDFSAHVLNLTGEERSDAEKEFQDAVLEIIVYLNALYPSAVIYWTHTGSINGNLAATVISDLDPLRIYVEAVVIYSPGDNNDPIGSGNHAREITHERNAQLLITKINERIED